jgi:hypothetical protein
MMTLLQLEHKLMVLTAAVTVAATLGIKRSLLEVAWVFIKSDLFNASLFGGTNITLLTFFPFGSQLLVGGSIPLGMVVGMEDSEELLGLHLRRVGLWTS